MKKTFPIYNSAMQVLYMVCRLGWQLCSNNLASFTAFKAIYTPAYIDAQLQAVKAAENIDNNQRRNAAAGDLRLDAEASALQVCSNWQSLKYYIGQAFSAPKLENALQSAGAASYAKASTFNWAELQVLMNAGQSFITDNLAKLTANGYMPASFPALFAADAATCLDKWLSYATNKSDKSDVAIDKVAANNALYTTLQGMFIDAREIFKASAMKWQFSFAAFKALAQGNGAGSVHGKVVSALTGKAVGEVNITVVNGDHKATANKRGGYRLDRVAAGSYEITFSKEGFETITALVTVETSTATIFNATLPAMLQLKVA